MQQTVRLILLGSILSAGSIYAQEVLHDTIPPFDTNNSVNGIPVGWRDVTFSGIKRHTTYKLVEEDTVYAESDNGASGLVCDVSVPTKGTKLRWRWKIEKTLKEGDASTKNGDDFPARVYVAFEYDPDSASQWTRLKYAAIKLLKGEYPPHSALNYVWANKLAKGEFTPSAYTGDSMIIALQSGDNRAGEWVWESIDIKADYLKTFGVEPPHKISGIGIMTDTDNTHGKARAWYRDISFIYN